MAAHRVSDLIGDDLDRAVAKAEGRPVEERFRGGMGEGWYEAGTKGVSIPMLSPSTDWAVGGPIIERERIELSWEAATCLADIWTPPAGSAAASGSGDTPLVAAMRAYLTAKFGETVSLP